MSKVVGKCPECGGDVVETKFGYGCTNYREKGCKFILWKKDKFLERFGAKMTEDIAHKLLLMKPFLINMRKGTKKFSCNISLEKRDNSKYWSYKLDFDKH